MRPAAIRLGFTSAAVGTIAQGTGDYFWNAGISDEAKIGVLRAGVDLGLTLIDTAEAYGDGQSEAIVARAIRGIRDQVTIATKFSPNHHTRADVLAAAENSLRRLGVDVIDLYQLHWPNPAIPLADTMDALCRLVETGKVRAVGVCNLSPMELKEARQALADIPLASVQVEYNLGERSAESNGLFHDCRRHATTVLAYSPLDQGRLGDLNSEVSTVVEAIASRHRCTAAQVVLRWMIGRDGIIPIVRSTKLNHVRENAAACDVHVSPADMEAIDRASEPQIVEIPTDRIRVTSGGEWNHQAYATVEEAIENRLGFTPSPLDLAAQIRNGEFLKPVRVVPAAGESADYEYDLIGGRIRYWAWVIAHEGRLPIPAYVRAATARVS